VPGAILRIERFHSQYVQPRHIDIWLPDGYPAAGDARYPVLYMHDGQNLFDPQTGYGGEAWDVQHALAGLIDAGSVPPAIIVGIWNSPLRWPEYLPAKPFVMAGGADALARKRAMLGAAVISDAYLRFLVTELKPFVDANYRTRPDQANTYIMGSSMGGLISLYALCEFPDVFAGAGCVSTHWPEVGEVIEPYLEATLPRPGRHKLYFDYGGLGLDAEYAPYQQRVDALMVNAGYQEGKDWLSRYFPEGDHNERSWRERVHIPLTFLLGQLTVTSGSDSQL